MPRGRPRQFDRDTALDRAVDLFWRRGYQDTSIAELTEHLGIASPSLYAAFGSKAALFCEAADRYQVTAGARPAIEMDAAATARDGIERLLRGNADLFTRPSGPRGCLLTRATLSCPAGDAAVRSYLERSRRQRLGQIEARLHRGSEAGERLPAAGPRPLARYYDTVVQGLAVAALEGTPRHRPPRHGRPRPGHLGRRRPLKGAEGAGGQLWRGCQRSLEVLPDGWLECGRGT